MKAHEVIHATGTLIQLSCPECQTILTAEMKLEDEHITQLLESMMEGVHHYSFKGIVKCECGKMVLSCLTVSAHGIKP